MLLPVASRRLTEPWTDDARLTFERFPRAGLNPDVSPLEQWKRLSASLNCDVWSKRDDVSLIGFGGNKVRKFDFILGEAIKTNVDSLVTTGSAQSNQCRLAAACGARLGFEVHLVIRAERGSGTGGNELLSELFGATLHYTGDHDNYGLADATLSEVASELAARGRRPFVIPLGASTPLGTVAYVEAASELAIQCRRRGIDPEVIFVTVGTGGTLAGLMIGVSLFMPTARVIGVKVSSIGTLASVRKMMLDACPLLDINVDVVEPLAERLDIREGFMGQGYELVTNGGVEALRSLARLEGVLVDLSYTAKTLNALVTIVRDERLRGPIVFWHTGGVPELFSRPREVLLGVPPGP